MGKLFKREIGITLVALIITIIVLLILAVVTINEVNEGSLFEHTQEAAKEYTIAAEKEELQLATSEWKMKKFDNPENITFKSFMTSRLSGKASVTGSNDGPLTVTFTSSGNEYTVNENGNTIEKSSAEGSNILVGKTFYSIMYIDGVQEELKTVEFISDTKAIISGYEDDEWVEYEYDYEYKDNYINDFWRVYILDDNIAIVAPMDEDHLNICNVVTLNKGANLIPLTGKTFKKNNSERIIEFSNENGYGKATDSINKTSWYFLIDTGDVCKVYIEYIEYDVTKVNGEYVSFTNGESTYELYTPEEP